MTAGNSDSELFALCVSRLQQGEHTTTILADLNASEAARIAPMLAVIEGLAGTTTDDVPMYPVAARAALKGRLAAQLAALPPQTVADPIGTVAFANELPIIAGDPDLPVPIPFRPRARRASGRSAFVVIAALVAFVIGAAGIVGGIGKSPVAPTPVPPVITAQPGLTRTTQPPTPTATTLPTVTPTSYIEAATVQPATKAVLPLVPIMTATTNTTQPATRGNATNTPNGVQANSPAATRTVPIQAAPTSTAAQPTIGSQPTVAATNTATSTATKTATATSVPDTTVALTNPPIIFPTAPPTTASATPTHTAKPKFTPTPPEDTPVATETETSNDDTKTPHP